MVKYRLNIESIMPTTEKDRQTFRETQRERQSDRCGKREGRETDWGNSISVVLGLIHSPVLTNHNDIFLSADCGLLRSPSADVLYTVLDPRDWVLHFLRCSAPQNLEVTYLLTPRPPSVTPHSCLYCII